MNIAYPNVADQLFGRAHAIEPIALRSIIDGPIGRRVIAGERLDGDGQPVRRPNRAEAAASGATTVVSADQFSQFTLTPDGVAIIPIVGVLAKRFDLMAAVCGWTTYESLSASLQSALTDERVQAILLDIDSPGGQVDGMLDIADQILAARTQMPIWAVADSIAASAAYAIAGSAEKLFLPRLAQVGSIGAVMVHMDQSAEDEANGQKYTAIFSGARKIDGWGHGSLTPEASAMFQARVDHCRQALASLVGRQGRISARDALNTEAAIYSDQDAVAQGLADGICTFGDALANLTARVQSTSKMSGVYVGAQSRQSSFRAEEVVQSSVDVVKPKVGEKCSCCGRIVKAAIYTYETMMETLNLCEEAGMSVEDTSALVKKETPILAVRRHISQRAATMVSLAQLGTATTAVAVTAADGTATTAEQWDKTISEINARFTPPLRRGRV